SRSACRSTCGMIAVSLAGTGPEASNCCCEEQDDPISFVWLLLGFQEPEESRRHEVVSRNFPSQLVNSNRVLSSDRDPRRGRACLASGQQGPAIRGMKSVLHARCLEANAVA